MSVSESSVATGPESTPRTHVEEKHGTDDSSLRQVWRIIRPRRGRGVLSVVLASLSLICAIALIATSA